MSDDIENRALPAAQDRATRASPRARAGLGHSASIPSAFRVFAEMLSEESQKARAEALNAKGMAGLMPAAEAGALIKTAKIAFAIAQALEDLGQPEVGNADAPGV